MFSGLINSCVESGTHTIPLGTHSSNKQNQNIRLFLPYQSPRSLKKIIAQGIFNLKRKRKEEKKNLGKQEAEGLLGGMHGFKGNIYISIYNTLLESEITPWAQETRECWGN